MLLIGLVEWKIHSVVSNITSQLRSLDCDIAQKEKEITNLKERKNHLKKHLTLLNTQKDQVKKYKLLKKTVKVISSP